MQLHAFESGHVGVSAPPMEKTLPPNWFGSPGENPWKETSRVGLHPVRSVALTWESILRAAPL